MASRENEDLEALLQFRSRKLIIFCSMKKYFTIPRFKIENQFFIYPLRQIKISDSMDCEKTQTFEYSSII